MLKGLHCELEVRRREKPGSPALCRKVDHYESSTMYLNKDGIGLHWKQLKPQAITIIILLPT